MTASSTASRRAANYARWGIVIAATFVLAVTAGGRFLMGVVFSEVRESFDISRGTLGLVVSVNVLIIGLAQPLVGWLVDRVPARVVAAGGLSLIALGMFVASTAHSLWQLVIGYSVLIAFGVAGVSPVTITPLVASWFERRRATALSIVSMGSPLGQLAIVPALTLMVGTIGWRQGYQVVALALLVVGAPLLLLLLKDRATVGSKTASNFGCSLRAALSERSFWQLGLGFFVCGFTMNWVSTYFFDYASANEISRGAAASSLSLMGGISIVGTLFTGWWADRNGTTLPLATVYALRGLGFGLLLVGGSNPVVVLLAMAIVGFSWSSTTPLTSALCADIYGRRRLGTIFGLMFAIMPLGSAVSAATTGFLYDMSGSYTSSLVMNLAVGLIAGIAVFVVQRAPAYERRPVSEPSSVPAD